ncbi:MAG TPA: DUF305 domain-containing protein [Bacteriovoracaceae bacterium]|nr:DUF305 domain-containing protein [Bacteriovoracaceae bacterium]
MKLVYIILLIVALQVQFAFASRYDAYFLDRMAGQNKETSQLAELAQVKSKNLELKRVARKILRKNHAEIKIIEEWRNSYFQDVPDFWVMPSKNLPELSKLENTDFDLQFLDKMIDVFQKGRIRLLDAQNKAEKPFLKSYTKKRLVEFDREIKLLISLKKKIMGES